MPSAAYNSLLAIAEKVKLWITPSRQTFAEIPCLNEGPSPEPQMTSVPLWSEDFFTYCIAKFDFDFDSFPAPITYNKVLRTLEETAQAQPREATRESNLRATATKQGYEIDLGSQTIEITGKKWKIKEANSAAIFHRPIANRPLPTPTYSEKPLAGHLRAAFGIKETKSPQDDPALALAQWLELALRPDTHCPPLILTGELSDQAADALRQLIDPASSNQLPFPTGRGEAGWMALYNRVLAFQVIGTITEFKRKVIKELSQGLFSTRLRQNDHKGPKRFQQLGRPVILALADAKIPDICGNQIHIEIHKCGTLPHEEVLAALFNQMVHNLRNKPKPRPEPANDDSPILFLNLANILVISPFP